MSTNHVSTRGQGAAERVDPAAFIQSSSSEVSLGGQTQRQPFHYRRGHVHVSVVDAESNRNAANSQPQSNSRPSPTEHDALDARYRYYSRLDPRSDSSLTMPTHVVPINFFSIIPFEELGPKQGSLITVFSIWNTMMGMERQPRILKYEAKLRQSMQPFIIRLYFLGTALLTMPWALNQAGFALGILLIAAVGALAFYTAFRVVDSPSKIGVFDRKDSVEFSDVCRYYFGKWGEYVAASFSLATLLGATIVYWVLMSNFLYFTDALYGNDTQWIVVRNGSLACQAVCYDHASSGSSDNASATFHALWQMRLTIPFYLVILVFPLLNFKSPTFFTKFNGLGTISVLYLFAFVAAKLSECGVNMNRTVFNVEMAKGTFPSLTGTLALSYFIHNAILSILKNQRDPQNNVRDLSFAYVLVGLTYSIVGVLFYISFPMNKSCIADNFLNNFGTNDILTSIARVFLLFQMLTVYPLLTFLIRVQFFCTFVGNPYPGLKHVLGLNAIVVALGVMFAIVLPSVGVILRFVGSITGLAYVFTLPCLVYLKQLKREGRLRAYHVLLHGAIVALGVANLIGQFVMLH